MDQPTIDLLVKFQPAIVGTVGFIGVITTLVVNGALARSQVRDNRRHEQQLVAQALAAELRFHEMVLSDLVRRATSEPVIGLHPPTLTPVLDAYIVRVGVLPKDRIEYVTAAYFIIKELDWKIRLHSNELPGLEWRQFKVDDVDKIYEAMKAALPVIERAIRALDPNPAPFRPA